MGRADIAILSTISGGIRLCLHPPALLTGGSAYDGFGPFSFLSGGGRTMFVATRRNVPRRPAIRSHLITHISARSVVTGSYGKIVSTCDGKSQLGSSPARSMQDGNSLCCARLASAISVSPTAFAAGRCFSFEPTVSHHHGRSALVERTLLGCFLPISLPALDS